MSKTTQKKAILNDLQDGHIMTPIDALTKHGCFRLAAVVFDLRALPPRAVLFAPVVLSCNV